MKKCAVGTYKKCVEMSLGGFRLVMATQFGPRILGCYVDDDENLFAVLPNRVMPGIGNGFKLYGGHRLWHAPEAKPRSYQPDNEPVEIHDVEDGVDFAAAAPEAATGILKRIQIAECDGDVFAVRHILENHGMWDVEVAPWALSMMAPGGMAVMPQGRHQLVNPYAPDRSLQLWPYSSFADPRLILGDDYYFLKQDSSCAKPVKIGVSMATGYGWTGYVLNGKALIKYFAIDEDGDYPDKGCVAECYSDKGYCEIETLGPLTVLEPGESTHHVEYWQAIRGLPEIRNEADFKEHVEPRLLDLSDADEDMEFDYSCCDDDDCGCGEADCRHGTKQGE